MVSWHSSFCHFLRNPRTELDSAPANNSFRRNSVGDLRPPEEHRLKPATFLFTITEEDDKLEV
jgi:hypothetical protein